MFESHATCRACPLRISTESSASEFGAKVSRSSSESEASEEAKGASDAFRSGEESSSFSSRRRRFAIRRAVRRAVARHAAFTSGSAAMPLSAMRCISPVRIWSSIGNTSPFPFIGASAFASPKSPMGSTTVCSARYPLSLGVAM